MFKSLIKKLEEENIPSNGPAIRDSIRDAGQAVMRQVKDKIEAAATSASSSTAGSASSSRTPSLIDIQAPDGLHTSGTAHQMHQIPQQPDPSLVNELNMTKRERDGLLLRNSQLTNLITQMKAELSEERNLRKSLEQEYKRPNEEIPFKVMLEKGSQTDDPVVPVPDQTTQNRQEIDSLMLRNAELSNKIEQLKLQVNEDRMERNEIEEELQQLKSQLLDREKQLLKQLAEERMQQQQEPVKPVIETIPLKEHKEVVQKLEETISEKNKTIKLQLQRITDIKKSIERGDIPATSSSVSSASNPSSSSLTVCNNNNSSSSPHLPSVGLHVNVNANDSAFHSSRPGVHSPPALLDVGSSGTLSNSRLGPTVYHNDHIATTMDVNFEYLRNVVFKFITSSEPESQKQLVKAIATLLQFDENQEHRIRETLDWRSSWLSSLPLVGSNLKPVSASSNSSSISSTSSHSSKTPSKSSSQSKNARKNSHHNNSRSS